MDDVATSDEFVAPHPSTALTEIVHQRTRLGILTVLAESRRADFTYLKSTLRLTDGNLGRHLEILAAEELIKITKGYEGRRPRTWAEITEVGQAALATQMASMKQLVNQFEALNSSSLDKAEGLRAQRSRREHGPAQEPLQPRSRNMNPRLSGA
jgi:DNA-binding PadR family transcriptional regulator